MCHRSATASHHPPNAVISVGAINSITGNMESPRLAQLLLELYLISSVRTTMLQPRRMLHTSTIITDNCEAFRSHPFSLSSYSQCFPRFSERMKWFDTPRILVANSPTSFNSRFSKRIFEGERRHENKTHSRARKENSIPSKNIWKPCHCKLPNW